MATKTRERRPSTSAPISELSGPVGPEFTRPKHKRTVTGFGAAEIKSVEASIPEPQREAYVPPYRSEVYNANTYRQMEETRTLLDEREVSSLTYDPQSLPKASQPRSSSRYVNCWFPRESVYN